MDATLIVRGTILTMEPDRPQGRAMAIANGRILAIGTEAQADRWRGKRTRVWALGSMQVAIPGFIDSHSHLAMDAWRHTWVDLSSCESLDAVLDRLRARAAIVAPGAWIVGRGWDESRWPTSRYVSRQDLDRVSVQHPILVNRVDGHMCSVNSAVLRRLGAASEVGTELGPNGSPTGVLKEAAAERARESIPKPTGAEWAHLLGNAIADAHSLGITSVHDVVDDRHIRAYQILRRQNRLSLRTYLCPYDDFLDSFAAAGMQTSFGDDWLRLGPIKVFADGSFGARTAALSRPYQDQADASGELNSSPKELTSVLERAHGAGFQLAVHAIGDRAIDVVLEAFARVLDDSPRDDHRHRIEHFELPSTDALEQMKELDLIASMQPNFVVQWSAPGGMYERRLGTDRVAGNNPYRLIRKRKISLAFGSDGMPYGPLYGLSGAVDGPFSSQRIAPEEAIRAYTVGGAYASFADDRAGTLAIGKFADLVVLSGDPRQSSPKGLAVDATVVDGKVVYRRAGPRRGSTETEARSR